jgi:hypothetical protein
MTAMEQSKKTIFTLETMTATMNARGVSLCAVNRMYANWRQHIQNLREEEAEEERRQGTLQNKRERGYR